MEINVTYYSQIKDKETLKITKPKKFIWRNKKGSRKKEAGTEAKEEEKQVREWAEKGGGW